MTKLTPPTSEDLRKVRELANLFKDAVSYTGPVVVIVKYKQFAKIKLLFNIYINYYDEKGFNRIHKIEKEFKDLEYMKDYMNNVHLGIDGDIITCVSDDI